MKPAELLHLLTEFYDDKLALMIEVVLGEMLEHKRFFDQALAGRTDLLGRRAEGAGAAGQVLPTRWIE